MKKLSTFLKRKESEHRSKHNSSTSTGSAGSPLSTTNNHGFVMVDHEDAVLVSTTSPSASPNVEWNEKYEEDFKQYLEKTFKNQTETIEKLMALPPKKKMEILKLKQSQISSQNSILQHLETTMNNIKHPLSTLTLHSQLKELRVVLSNYAEAEEAFINRGGVEFTMKSLSNNLQNLNGAADENNKVLFAEITISIIMILTQVCKNNEGLEKFLDHPNSIEEISKALLLDHEDKGQRNSIYFLLSSLCFCKDGAYVPQVYDSVKNLSKIRGEEQFLTVVQHLREASSLKNRYIILAFINILMRQAPVQFRRELKQRFISAGVYSEVKKLEKLKVDNKDTDDALKLSNQIEIFNKIISGDLEEDIFDDLREIVDQLEDSNTALANGIKDIAEKILDKCNRTDETLAWVNDIKTILDGKESINLLKDRNLSLQKQIDSSTKDNTQLKDQVEKLAAKVEALEKAPPTVIVKKVAVIKQVGELKSSGSSGNLSSLNDTSPTASIPASTMFATGQESSQHTSLSLESNSGIVPPPLASSVSVPPPPVNLTVVPPVSTSTVPIPPVTNSFVPPPPMGFSSVPPSSSIPVPPGMGSFVPPPPTCSIPMPPGMNQSTMPPPPPVNNGCVPPPPGSSIPLPPGFGGVPPPPGSSVPMPPGMNNVPPPPGSTVPMPPGMGVPLPPGMAGMGVPPPPSSSVPMPPGMGVPPPPGVPMPPGMGVPVPPPGMGTPPPPMFGFVPSPIVPSGPKLPDIPKKKAAVPTKDVRLNKLDNNKLQKSVWMKKNLHAKLFDIEIPEKELEDMFAQISKSPSLGMTPEKSDKPKDTTISLLEGSRLQNVSIFMRYLKMPSNQLVEKLLAISDEFNEESIGKLLNQVPNEDEIQRQNDFDGDENTLNEADKFIRAMMKVPRLTSRLKCWNFKLKYVETKACINPDLETLTSTCKSVVESEKLQELFAVILAFSNYLSKTGIHGFKLNSLQKLKETKANAKNVTLLDMIVKHITSTKPEILKVKEDLNMLERAARVEMQTLSEKIDNMEKSITLLNTEIQYHTKNPQPNDRFLEVFGSFLTECEDQLKVFKEKQQTMESELVSVAEFLGEDPNAVKKEPKDIFLMLNSFINDLLKSVDNLKKEEEKRKKEESKQAKEKGTSRPSSPVVTVGGLKAMNSFRTPSKTAVAEKTEVSVTPSSPVTPIAMPLLEPTTTSEVEPITLTPTMNIQAMVSKSDEKEDEGLSPAMTGSLDEGRHHPGRRVSHLRKPSILMSLEKSLYEGSALLSPSTKTRKRGGGVMTAVDINELNAVLNKRK